MANKSPFTAKEFAFLRALREQKVPFLVVGLAAATLQGAPVVTQDIDLWIKDLGDSRFKRALKKVGGFYVPPWGLNPPLLGGEGLDLFDLVMTVHGLGTFDQEYRRRKTIKLETLSLPVLSLDRIIKSKRAAGRAKDKAALPVLEDALRTIKSSG